MKNRTKSKPSLYYSRLRNSTGVFILSISFFVTYQASAQWIAVNNGLPPLFTIPAVNAIAIDGSNIFAGTFGNGMFISSNDGNIWSSINSGLPTTTDVTCLAISGSSIFMGSVTSGVSLTTNNGITWNAVSTGLPICSVNALATSGSSIFAGTSLGVYLSTNNGSTWNLVATGLPASCWVTALATSGSNIFLGTYGSGVYLSTNNGSSWTAMNTGMAASAEINCFAISGSNIFVGTYNYGVYLSTNNGSSWSAVNTGLAICGPPGGLNISVLALAITRSNIFAGMDGAGVYLSTNNGSSWTAMNTGLTCTYDISFATTDSNIFVGTLGCGVFRTKVDTMQQQSAAGGTSSVYVPTAFSPNGDNHNDIEYVYGGANISTMDFIIFDRWGNKVFESTNPGYGWDGTYKGQPMNTGTYVYYLISILQDGTSFNKKGNITLVR